MARLILQDISQWVDKQIIIDKLTVTVADGEFLVIVGPSGCGKTTLLRLIAGFDQPSSGSVLLDDCDLSQVSVDKRNIAMVFQNYALYPHMTVADNLSYCLRIRKIPTCEIKAQVHAVAKRLDISHLLRRKPGSLSGGQRQRVAMGRAIIRKPNLFLFDEPLSNLDANLRTRMRIEIKELQRALGVTSIYVTHDQTEAMTLADKILVLQDGRVQQVGTPLEIYHQPENQFVAGFMGSPPMNFIPLAYHSPLGQWLFKKALMPVIGHDEEVILGIRPEDIAIGTEGTLVVPFYLTHLEILGAETLLYGRVAGATEPVIARIKGVHSPAILQEIPLSFSLEKCHFFSSKTGLRL